MCSRVGGAAAGGAVICPPSCARGAVREDTVCERAVCRAAVRRNAAGAGGATSQAGRPVQKQRGTGRWITIRSRAWQQTSSTNFRDRSAFRRCEVFGQSSRPSWFVASLTLLVSDFMLSFLFPVAPRLRASVLLVPALVLCWATALQPSASAQRANRSPEALQGVGVEQRLGASLPQSLTFRNEAGESVPLRTYFDGETPVMLTLNYHRCPQLCRIQLQKFARALGGLEWTAGETYTVVTVDISPEEGPAIARTAKKRYTAVLDEPEKVADGWHFLTGERPAIQALADSVGIRYKRLQNKEHQFAHPAAIVFLSGSGTITRYFTTLSPSSGNVRTALVEASNGTVGTLADRAFLACARFDPDANSYSASAFKIMRYGSVFAALLIGATLFVFWRREKKQLDAAQEEGLEGLVKDRA